MQIFDIIAVFALLALGLSYYFSSIFNVVTSSISALFAAIIIRFIEDPLVNKISNMGWQENIYSPALIYILLFVVMWGIIFSLFSYLPRFRLDNKIIKIILTVIFTIFSTLIILNIFCLSLPAFLSSQETALNLKNSFICIGCTSDISVNTKPKSLQSIVGNSATPQTSTELIILPSNFALLSQSTTLENRLLGFINETRKTNGVAELDRNVKLDQLASSYARSIIETKRFSHLDSSNSAPADRAQKADLKFNYFGENLAVAPSVDKAHEIIMQSKTHRDNLISPAFRSVGIAVIIVAPNQLVVVEEFSN